MLTQAMPSRACLRIARGPSGKNRWRSPVGWKYGCASVLRILVLLCALRVTCPWTNTVTSRLAPAVRWEQSQLRRNCSRCPDPAPPVHPRHITKAAPVGYHAPSLFARGGHLDELSAIRHLDVTN